MSRENVEAVRHIYEAVARGDAERVFSLYHDDVELDTSGLDDEAVLAGVFRGHEGLRQFFREWGEAWEESDFELDELIPAGERVVSVVTRHGRGRVSGIEVETPGAVLWTIHEGKASRMVLFSTKADALEAVGLRE